jgi:hypothetical protein
VSTSRARAEVTPTGVGAVRAAGRCTSAARLTRRGGPRTATQRERMLRQRQPAVGLDRLRGALADWGTRDRPRWAARDRRATP